MGRSRSPLHRPVSSRLRSSPIRFTLCLRFPPLLDCLSVSLRFFLKEAFFCYNFTNLAYTNSEVNLLMFCLTNLLILHNLHCFHLVL